MDRNTTNSIIFGVLSTLDEIGQVPQGVLYAGLMERGVTLDWFQRLVETLRVNGLVRTAHGSHWELEITEKGRALVREVTA